MSSAEQKRELLRMVSEADEETTAKLIDFFQHLAKEKPEFSEKDIIEFNRRRDNFLQNPDSGIPWEESLSRLRNELSK
ncbi:MAG: hypothetical protein M3Y85_08730 [Bacteroidota bacterium]|nr:hypothetical protein [Bacteroidota bacterium]